jgi:hypothetical protein
MRLMWELHRRAVIGAVLGVILAVAAVSLAMGTGHHHAITAQPPTRPRTSVDIPRPLSGGAGANSNGPLRVNPPATPNQTQVDADLAASESAASIAQAEQENMPAPAVSEQFPALAASDEQDPTAYALAFCRELLSIDYRQQSRTQLLSWAEYEEAPDTLPGVPASIADKSLVGSLAYAGTAGAEATPIPTAAAWKDAASSASVQQVSGLTAAVAPDWSALVGSGWQPVDPLMTILTVTGAIRTTATGQPANVRPFSLALTLGGARHHSGYGSVAVSAWTNS